nr:hypothetical protein [Acidithiobacillus ferriphilus]
MMVRVDGSVEELVAAPLPTENTSAWPPSDAPLPTATLPFPEEVAPPPMATESVPVATDACPTATLRLSVAVVPLEGTAFASLPTATLPASLCAE